MRRAIATIAIETVGLAAAATAITTAFVVASYTPQNALVGLWLYFNQPAYWLLAVLASVLHYRFPTRPVGWPIGLKWIAAIVFVTTVGWAGTWLALWLHGDVYAPWHAG